jgi:hypothetical protein
VVLETPPSLASTRRHKKPIGLRQRQKAARHLLPDGPESIEELRYLFRGVTAARGSLASVTAVTANVTSKLSAVDAAALQKVFSTEAARFEGRTLDPMLPTRPDVDRSASESAQVRAHRRAREANAFQLGAYCAVDDPTPPTSELEDRWGELIEQSVSLQMMTDPLPDDADPAKLHLAIDDLEVKTEETIVALERGMKQLGTTGGGSQ